MTLAMLPTSLDNVAGSIAVPYVDLAAQSAADRADIDHALARVFAAGDFVGGAAVAELEVALARACGTRHAVAVGSGTDALILTLRAFGIGPGDEVLTPPNSFVASTSCIVSVGATPVFVDVDIDQNLNPLHIESAITPRTKAILPVHLTGRIAEMDVINAQARKSSLLVIEDAAQAMGSQYHGKAAGSLGDAGCFSTHPLKNLSAAGDGGFVTTNDAEVASRIRCLRNHGLTDRDTVTEWGTVSRMDTLQAAILLARLKKLDKVIARRRENAALYRKLLDSKHIQIPRERPNTFDTYHTFVVQVDRRDELQAYLLERGIESFIHYPTPIHLQPAAHQLGYGPGDFPAAENQAERILTLPVHQFLQPMHIEAVAVAVNSFFRG